MKLVDIMMEFAHVENGLAEGSIRFSYDKLMCAMKPGHPADIMDDIFGRIGDAVYFQGEDAVTKEQLADLLKNLTDFSKAFRVKELKDPLKHLKEYLNPVK